MKSAPCLLLCLRPAAMSDDSQFGQLADRPKSALGRRAPLSANKHWRSLFGCRSRRTCHLRSMIVHSAESAARASHLAPYLWVRSSEAGQLRCRAPWISEFPPQTVNGETAVLFKHPPRERVVMRFLDGDAMTAPEALYRGDRPLGLIRRAFSSRAWRDPKTGSPN